MLYFSKRVKLFGILKRSDFGSWSLSSESDIGKNSWQNCEWQADSTSSRRLKTYLPGKKTKNHRFPPQGFRFFQFDVPGRVFCLPFGGKLEKINLAKPEVVGCWANGWFLRRPAIWPILSDFEVCSSAKTAGTPSLEESLEGKSGGLAQGNPWVGWPSAKIKRLNLLSRWHTAMEHSSMSKPLTLRLRGCQVFWKDFSWNSQKTTPRKGSWNQAWHIRQGYVIPSYIQASKARGMWVQHSGVLCSRRCTREPWFMRHWPDMGQTWGEVTEFSALLVLNV